MALITRVYDRRSIPARTGEPAPRCSHPSPATVYPRAYGGTDTPEFRHLLTTGLSPRVRGNPSALTISGTAARSIPARTGEPTRTLTSRRRSGVYPRAYGGTHGDSPTRSGLPGLSPRVRGNHIATLPQLLQTRSIPARTGEPWRSSRSIQRLQVYPRAYGGTRIMIEDRKHLDGLSPRVRGNLLLHRCHKCLERSIPARTGEPGAPSTPPKRSRVYPRAYGGTAARLAPGAAVTGLSPRVRGNLLRYASVVPGHRSIPARTGEPRRPVLPRSL